MSRADKISQRFPHFYRSWDTTSQIALLASAIGKCLDETEKDLVSIIHSHWVDKANGQDLDKLGALISTERNGHESDKDYRNRLKLAVLRYHGGTLESVRNAVRIALKLPQNYPITINENPGVNRTAVYNIKKDGSWQVDLQNVMSVQDAPLDITLSVRTEWGKIRDPRIINLESKDSVAFIGDIAYGDILKISHLGNASLNGEDKTASLKISGTRRPYRGIQRTAVERLERFMLPNLKALTLPRNGSKWMLTFSEIIWAEMGFFDKSHFDKSYFLLDKEPHITLDYGAFNESHFDKCYFLLDKEPPIIFEHGIFDKSHFDTSYFSFEEEPHMIFEYGIFDKNHLDKSYFLLDKEPHITLDYGAFNESNFDKCYFLLDEEPPIPFDLGVFDESHFDASCFSLDPEISVIFEWIASQPAMFELEITKRLIKDAGITEDKLKEVLNTAKASGVRADLKVISIDI